MLAQHLASCCRPDTAVQLLPRQATHIPACCQTHWLVACLTWQVSLKSRNSTLCAGASTAAAAAPAAPVPSAAAMAAAWPAAACAATATAAATARRQPSLRKLSSISWARWMERQQQRAVELPLSLLEVPAAAHHQVCRAGHTIRRYACHQQCPLVCNCCWQQCANISSSAKIRILLCVRAVAWACLALRQQLLPSASAHAFSCKLQQHCQSFAHHCTCSPPIPHITCTHYICIHSMLTS